MTKTQIKQVREWAESCVKNAYYYDHKLTTTKQILARFVHQFHLIGISKFSKADYIDQISLIHWNGRKAVKNMTLKELYKEIDEIYKLFGTKSMTFEELVEATIGD